MPGRSAAAWLAAGVFAFLLIRPAYIASLRERNARDLPEAWSRVHADGPFKSLFVAAPGLRQHDEAHYAARVNQILLHGLPYNPYWRGDRSLGSWLHDCLALFPLAAVAALCGGDISLAWIVAAALVGAGWFLFFLSVFRWWSGSMSVAVPLALFSTLFPDVYVWLLDINLSPTVNLERWSQVFFQHMSTVRPNFYRLPSLFLSTLALALLFLGLWRLLRQERPRPALAAVVGAGFGLMCLVHAFEFAFGMAALAAAAAAAWAFGLGRGTRWNLSCALGAAVAAAAAYSLAMALGVDPQARADSLEMSGLTASRRPYAVSLVHLLFAAWAARLYRRETDPGRRAAWLLLGSAQAGAFLCRNAQVVTGVSIQPYHFIPFGSFAGALALLLLLSRRLASMRWWDRRWGMAASACVLLLALSNEKAAAERTYRMFGLDADQAAGLDWVRANLRKDDLILSLSMETNELVPLYTQAKVQVPPASPPISTPLTKERYLAETAALLRTVEADVEAFLRERWLLPADKAALGARLVREERYFQEVDGAAFESFEWFYPWIYGRYDAEHVLEGHGRLRALHAAAEPLRGPLFIWVNDKDRHLLRRPPEAYGARRVFERGSVRIYSYAAG